MCEIAEPCEPGVVRQLLRSVDLVTGHACDIVVIGRLLFWYGHPPSYDAVIESRGRPHRFFPLLADALQRQGVYLRLQQHQAGQSADSLRKTGG